ncbi:hypothetical protein D3C75_1275430 [compost metagenome]
MGLIGMWLVDTHACLPSLDVLGADQRAFHGFEQAWPANSLPRLATGALSGGIGPVEAVFDVVDQLTQQLSQRTVFLGRQKVLEIVFPRPDVDQ